MPAIHIFRQVARLVVMPLLVLLLTAGHAHATPAAKPKPSASTKPAAKPAAKPAVKPATPPVAKATTPAKPKATTPTRTYIAGGKDGPCACTKGKSCKDGAGKRYCVESNDRKRLLG